MIDKTRKTVIRAIQKKGTTMSLLGFLAVFLFSTSNANDFNNAPVTETKVGTIVGTFYDVKVFGQELKVARFLGIPYAEPPVGDLRFKKPVPKQPFASPYKALKHGNICHQMNILPLLKEGQLISEDCLFLNVYVPARGKDDLPVMIWIHGGGFVAGASDTYVSDALAAYGDVIVVTINYRLSLWGFLSTGDEHAPGNYGLFDQHLAIKWVHENIKGFGGDTRRLTIFGESAGAASVIYQGTFEENRGLFQRAIAQSGAIAEVWTVTEDPKAMTEKLGKLVGCKSMASGALVDCIKRVDASILDTTINNVTNGFIKVPCPFLPNIDGDFIKKSPKQLIKPDSALPASNETFFGTLDFLTGINSEEGALMMNSLVGINDPEHFEPNRTMFEDELVPTALSISFGKDIPKIIIDLVIHEYTDWEDQDNIEKIRNKLIQIYGDSMFSMGMLKIIDYHNCISDPSKSKYVYEFDVKPSAHFLPMPSWAQHASHADELEYLFFDESGGIMTHLPFKDGYKPQDWESGIAEYMITMWSNFAKTGNPNKPIPVRMFWPAYNKKTQHYLHITRNMSSDSVKRNLLPREFNLWNKIIPAVLKALSEKK